MLGRRILESSLKIGFSLIACLRYSQYATSSTCLYGFVLMIMTPTLYCKKMKMQSICFKAFTQVLKGFYFSSVCSRHWSSHCKRENIRLVFSLDASDFWMCSLPPRKTTLSGVNIDQISISNCVRLHVSTNHPEQSLLCLKQTCSLFISL